MAQGPRRIFGWYERRVERKGLRPRFAAYLIVAVWLVAVVIFGVVEHVTDPKTFHTVWLGMWGGVETVTTVGYGDVVPQSTPGKIVASVLMLGGLSFLAIITALITSAFVTRAQTDAQTGERDDVLEQLHEISAQLAMVKEQLARQHGNDQRDG
jgi:voltage-gated potassium channel Kch